MTETPVAIFVKILIVDILALYMNGNAITEYPINKFTSREKGNLSDTFYTGRDGRSWMLDPEGSHIVYCTAMQQDNEFGVGIHWGNDIDAVF